MDRIVLPIDEDTLVPNMEANYIANVDGVSVESMCDNTYSQGRLTNEHPRTFR